MGDDFALFDIIIFAMLAGYLVFQLRRVLGRRTGHQQRRPNSVSKPPSEAANNDERLTIAGPDTAETAEDDPTPAEAAMSPYTRLKALDPDYDERDFLRGARAAFEWIVAVFSRGDRAELENLLSPQLMARFEEAIDRREAAGETLETTVSAVRSAMIEDVEIHESVITITVEFISDQVKVVRDAAGAVIDGDPDRFETLTDIWSFRRDIRSGDPNWQLVSTREPAE